MVNEGIQKFTGFRTPNYTQVPDEIFDILLPLLSGAELKVLLYICRRTFGFKKDSDAISLTQISGGITTRDGRVLDSGTGLSKRHVQRAIKTLEELKTVRILRSLDADGVNEVNTYTLNFIDGGVGTKSPYGRDMDVRRVGTPVSPTRNSKQDTETNVNDGVIKNKADNDTNEHERATVLVADLMEELNDRNPRSKATFRKIVIALGTDKTYRLLGNTKEAYRDRVVSRAKMAAYFIGMAKNVAKEIGVDIGFKTEHGKPTNGNQPNVKHYPVQGIVAELASLKRGFRNKARSVTAQGLLKE